MKMLPVCVKRGRRVNLTAVDDADYDRALPYKWRLRWDARVDGLVGKKTILLHRFILSAPRNKHVDHIDGNPLNNLRSNLRLCDPHSNTLNQVGKPRQRKCRYKGVTPKNGRFIATISNQTKRSGILYIGGFETEREAAIAYDISARTLHGEFARLNIPDATEEEKEKVLTIINSPKANCIGASSSYRGVDYHKPSNKWRARIKDPATGKTVGKYVDSEIDAALAYNEMATRLRGREAVLNKI